MALTAGHVVRSASNPIFGMFVVDTSWELRALIDVTMHESEDLAALQLERPSPSEQWVSWIKAPTSRPRGALGYHLWGYPEDAAYELVADGQAAVRPDLVYSEGHIRRTLSGVPMPNVRGSHLLELSVVAGGGCSGSPILLRTYRHEWDLLGVYLGERTNDRATSASYALTSHAFIDWVPAAFGRSVGEELASNAEPTVQHPL